MQRMVLCLRLLTALALIGGMVLAASPASADEAEAAVEDLIVDEATPPLGEGPEPAAPEAPEPDGDLDGIPDGIDTCAAIANPDQVDIDGDGVGDACEPDGDADGVADDVDVCALVPDPAQGDADGDGLGDACEPDGDGDGIVDDLDICPAVANPDQADAGGDGVGDACAPVEAIVPTAEAPVPADEPDTVGDAAVVPDEDDVGSVAADAAPGQVIVNAVDDAGGVFAWMCFDLYLDAGGGARGDYVASACDYYDGGDGTTVFVDLPAGAYVLSEQPFYYPQGYLLAPDQPFALGPSEAEELTVVHRRVGSLVVLKVAPGGGALPGACFQIFLAAGDGSPGAYITDRCDAYDGANDGTTTFESATGDLVLVESQVPAGYLAAPNLPVHVEPAETKTVTVEDPLGGTLVVRKVDGTGAPLTDAGLGACVQLWTDAGDGSPAGYVGEQCDAYDGVNDGALAFNGLATAAYVLIEVKAPTGYLPGPNQPASVIAGQTTEIVLANEQGGALVVTTLGDQGKPSAGACYEVYADAGGGTPGQWVAGACDGADGAEDGVVTLVGLNGSNVLVQSRAPDGYLQTANWRFRVRPGQTLTRAVWVQLGGVLVVHRVDQAGNALPGSGFDLWTDAGGGQLGTYVAGGYDWSNGVEDGTLTFSSLPSGDYVLREFWPPTGYLGAAPMPVRVKAGKTVEVSFTNRLGATLRVQTVDADGELVPGACFGLYRDAGDGTPGEGVAGECDYEDGIVEIVGIPTGSYVLRQGSAAFGFIPADDRLVSLVEGETTTVEVANVALGKVVLHTVDQFGNTVVGACFETSYAHVGGGTAIRCDGGFFPMGDGEPDGYVTIEYLDGDHLIGQSGVPAGYLGAGEFTVHVKPGEVLVVPVVNPLGASVQISTVDAQGQALPNGCFNLHLDAGGGTPGDHVTGACDWYDGGTDGTISFIGLLGDDYVLVESFPPNGYRPVADQVFRLELGESRSLALVHQPISVLVVTKLDETDEPLAGACFAVYVDDGVGASGWPVAELCDDADGAGDGSMRLVGLEPGAYLLVETVTPSGYLPLADPQPFALSEGQTTAVPVRNVLGATAVVALSGPDGAPLPGGCFFLYSDLRGEEGEFVYARDLCDGADGAEDGQTTFVGLATSDYHLQAQLPFGYFGAEDVAFHVEAGQILSLRVDARQTGTLILHRVDESGAEVGGGCVAVYVDAGGGELGQWVGYNCEGMDEDLDGTSVLQGFRPGAYVVVDDRAPEGYLRAPNLGFTIAAGETVERTILNRLGGVLTIYTADATGSPVPGGCFTAYVDAGDGALGAELDWACDGDGAGGGIDGTTTLVGLEGDLILVHSAVPYGYLPAPNASFSIAAGETQEQTVTLTLGGILRIETVDETGAPIVGACFNVFRDAGDGTSSEEWLGGACDSYEVDGADGTTIIVGLATADVVAVEIFTPSGYGPAAPAHASVETGQTTTVTVAYSAA